MNTTAVVFKHSPCAVISRKQLERTIRNLEDRIRILWKRLLPALWRPKNKFLAYDGEGLDEL